MPHFEDDSPPLSPHVQEAIIPGEYTKLILCFDGTGNTFSGTNADTNVVKILRKLDRNNDKQFHYYQTGIGTYDVNESSIHKTPLGELRSKVSKTIDQGFGTTFDAHIMAGYRFIMRYYEPKAKIYIFGFSRGAYTAKYLSRMVNKVGLLCKGNEEMVPFAYRLYARALQCESEDRVAAQNGSKTYKTGAPDATDRDTLLSQNGQPNNTPNGLSNGVTRDVHDDSAETSGAESDEPSEHAPAGAEETTESDDEEDKSNLMVGGAPVKRRTKTKIARREVKAFSQTFCRNENTDPTKHRNIKVYFLGMWDCVNSVAVVEKSAPAPVEVTGTARHVRHAVAVDERRVKFKPALLAQDIRTVVNDARKKKEEEGMINKKKNKKGKKKNRVSMTEEQKKLAEKQRKDEEEYNKEDIREVWFPGNHGDIGGGWPAMPELRSPEKMGWGEFLGHVFSTMKPKDVSGGLKNNDLQMSDMALDWMIREVELVGREDRLAAVHWCHTLDSFKKAMNNEGNVQKHVIEGFKHDTLSFGYGSSFFKVFMWKFMEMLPGIPRWELNDEPDKPEDKGWESWRWKPNFGSFRDIPRGAILHDSLIKRLLSKKVNYLPENNHGKGAPCLLGPGGKGAAETKAAAFQNQKALEDYENLEEQGWAARHQLWQLKE